MSEFSNLGGLYLQFKKKIRQALDIHLSGPIHSPKALSPPSLQRFCHLTRKVEDNAELTCGGWRVFCTRKKPDDRRQVQRFVDLVQPLGHDLGSWPHCPIVLVLNLTSSGNHSSLGLESLVRHVIHRLTPFCGKRSEVRSTGWLGLQYRSCFP